MSTTEYRWNQLQAAAAYDAAAPIIHPRYVAVQDAVLAAIPFNSGQPFRAVDLGGGSGRLAERILQSFPAAEVTLVDQSGPFLSLAADRLAPFGERGRLVESRLQDDWPARVGLVDVIVSTSAIHHLDAEEKQSLFNRAFATLRPGGRLINGDEYRPQSDDAYRAMLEAWGAHMDRSLAAGSIPETFGPIIAGWRARNLDEFGRTPTSGDDCTETVEAQVQRLRAAGFTDGRVLWADQIWAVLAADRG